MFVYVLEDCNGNQYVGITGNLKQRLEQHKAGETVGTSKMHLQSLEYVHYWLAPSYSYASRLEKYLHTVHKDVVSDIILDCPFWCKVLKEAAELKELTWYENYRDKRGSKFYYVKHHH